MIRFIARAGTVALLSSVFVVTAPPPVSADAPSQPLRVSRSATRKPSVPLQGNSWTANEAVYVFLDRELEGRSVTFAIDGVVQRVDTSAPWDLKGGDRTAIAFVNNLAAGSHTIKALLTRTKRKTSTYEATFNVGDTTPPSVISISPTPGATGVSTAAPFITITFSEPIQAAPGFGLIGLQETNRVCCLPAAGRIVGGNTIVVDTGAAPFALTPSANYTLHVFGVVDASGNASAPFDVTFTTGPVATDTAPPSVASITPANGATGVATFLPLFEPLVTLVFSEPVQYGDFSSYSLATLDGTPVPLQAIQCCNTQSFAPVAPLLPFTTYLITFDRFRDWAGNTMPTFTSTFTTGAA
jgi:Bacterial Ig-like domain